jgi:hypothetical protein
MAILQAEDVFVVVWSHVEEAMTSDNGPASGDWRRPRNELSGD